MDNSVERDEKLQELQEEVVRLEKARDNWKRRAEHWNQKYDSELSRLQAERDKAIEGLRWYANKHNYVISPNDDPFDISPESVVVDGGDLARDVLSELGVPHETT